MGERAEHEHFIPLRRSELIELLSTEPGMSSADTEQFRLFSQLLSARYHYEFHRHLERLKNAYAPFDPDADTRSLQSVGPDERVRRLNELNSVFAWLMERANFKHLSRQDLEPSLHEASILGLRMDVDFSAFEHLAIFGRGEGMRTVRRRRRVRWWRFDEVRVPAYQRLVMILKLRHHKRVPKTVDTDKVYLKIFKDIPRLDVKMMLPTARVRMTKLDRSRVTLPFLSGIGMAVWKAAATVLAVLQQLFTDFTTLLGLIPNSPLVFWGIASTAFGYGTKSYFAYQGTKQQYQLLLTESLYFQTLDSNAGVLYRLLDEAEEQECREALLAYFFLWRQGGEPGLTPAELQARIGQCLDCEAHVRIDFESGDALHKLEQLRLAVKEGERYRALPLNRALEMLDLEGPKGP